MLHSEDDVGEEKIARDIRKGTWRVAFTPPGGWQRQQWEVRDDGTASWRDEAAVKAWHQHAGHQAAQAKSRGEIFKDCRVRVAEMIRDYT